MNTYEEIEEEKEFLEYDATLALVSGWTGSKAIHTQETHQKLSVLCISAQSLLVEAARLLLGQPQ